MISEDDRFNYVVAVMTANELLFSLLYVVVQRGGASLV